MKVQVKYGHISPSSPVTDLRNIFKQIRKQINVQSLGGLQANNDDMNSRREALTELVSRARYLCTMVGVGHEASPTWKDKYYGNLTEMQRAAKEEFTKTARKANKLVKRRKVKGPKYDTHYG